MRVHIDSVMMSSILYYTTSHVKFYEHFYRPLMCVAIVHHLHLCMTMPSYLLYRPLQ